MLYRKDPTFHNEKTMTVYQGGSIETLLCLKNGHLAISGSSQNNRLVICDVNTEVSEQQKYKVINEFTDHSSTITGLIELSKSTRLISCGIDKNIFIYDIIEKAPPKTSISKTSKLF